MSILRKENHIYIYDHTTNEITCVTVEDLMNIINERDNSINVDYDDTEFKQWQKESIDDN